jgi:hypothetical protein
MFISGQADRRSTGHRAGALDGLGRALYDNWMIETFRSRMQVELLDRNRWKTRVELANAIFEYLEAWRVLTGAWRKSECERWQGRVCLWCRAREPPINNLRV